MSVREVPGELGHVMQLTPDRKRFLPLLYVDELSMRLRDLVSSSYFLVFFTSYVLSDQVRVNATDKTADLTLVYRPISMGKLRLFMQVISSHII